MNYLSVARAYVEGESLYEKAQKNAVFSLRKYVTTYDEKDYEKFKEYLKGPVAYNNARLELEKSNPDMELVYMYFEEGGSHPSDAIGMAQMYKRFRKFEYMNNAITLWKEADELIIELLSLGEEIHDETAKDLIAHNEIHSRQKRLNFNRINMINDQITDLGKEFSFIFGEVGRWSKKVTLSAMIISSLIITIIGLFCTAVISKGILSNIRKLLLITEHICNGDFTKKVEIQSNDEIGLLAVSFNNMTEKLNAVIVSRDKEIEKRRTMEAVLQKAYDELEQRVEDRTMELSTANEMLKKEIEERKQSEKERKRLEVQLSQAQKMEAIGTLAGGIAHDFNNILFLIVGYTEILKFTFEDHLSAKENLNKILIAADRGKNLIRQILTFSRQGVAEYTPLMLQTVLKETLKLLRSSIPTNIEITQDLDNKCGIVMSDPTQIHQIIMNLCTNAYHAMQETGGKISISLSEVELGSDERYSMKDMKPGRYACINVSDTGHGMDPDILSRIFDPYFTTKELGKGTGMGLSVSHGIVKSHGGDIKVYSELGQGSVFQVYLPIADVKASELKEELSMTAIRGNERVLLVDDEAQIVAIEQQLLESLGYHVTPANSSSEALDLFARQPENFDIVISDMTMPHMTGDQFAKKVMEIRKDIPVILCTGFSDRATEEKMKAIGVRALVMKPILRRNLGMTIRTIMDEIK